MNHSAPALWVLLAVLILSGCATVNPIQHKYQDLEVLHKTGKLTTDEYEAAKQKIMKEEISQARAKFQADIQELHAKREH
jgi:hypothetical protein